MNINSLKISIIVFCLALSALAQAASVTVNGNGSTFIINKNGGFDGVDGADREAAFVAAVQVWADILVSPTDIVIDAEFSSALFCNSTSATLGSAGPLSTYFSSGAESFGLQNNVWYPTALINAYYGSDYFTGNADISAQFNADIGNADCLASSGWYYGMDGNTPSGYIDFYEVVLHELGHGLGILSLVMSDGNNNGGIIDIFTTFLKDQTTAKAWSAMSSAERNSSVVNDGNVVWDGAAVTALSGDLTAGVNSGKVQMYAPSSYEGGSSISHFDTELNPNELMEPQYTGDASHDHSTALLQDIGWNIYSSNNAIPVITGQSALATDEDTAITLALSDLTVADSDNNFPSDFTLTVYSGVNYSVSENMVTPNENFNGTLTVPVSVNDGADDSENLNLSITVNSVNDKPLINAQSNISVDEDNSLLLSVSMLTIADPDDTSFTLNVGSGANYSVSGSEITPALNFSGALTVPVTVNDGEANSDSYNLIVTVNAINDKPSITTTPTVSIDEDTSHSFTVSDFTISDPDDATFSLVIVGGDNYSISGNTVTPNTHFNGTLSVGAYVNDGQTNSSTVSFSLSVNSINDAPVINGAPSTTVTYPGSYSSTFSATDVDSGSITFSVSSAHGWLSINNAGQLTGTPTNSDIGTQAVTVTASDGALSDNLNFNLTVADANSSDLSVTLNTAEELVGLNESAVINVSAINDGPKVNADGYLLITVDANTSISAIHPNCTFNTAIQVRCDFTGLLSSKDYSLTVSQSSSDTDNISAEIFGTQTDPDGSNNWQDLTLIFNDNQTSPQLTDTVLATQNTQAASFGDLDGDNKKEILFANGGTTAEYGYKFNAEFSSLTQSEVFTTQSSASSVLIVDLNNDQLNDVVFAHHGANSVFFNQGNGTFGSAISLGSSESHSVVAIDINHDNYLDLVFANSGVNQIYVNNQANGFTVSDSFGDADTSDIDVIDYNLDGYPDLIVTNLDDSDLVYLNAGEDQTSGILASSPILIGSTVTESHAVVVADMNNDGTENEFFIARSTGENIPSLELYRVNSNVLLSVATIDAGDVVSLAIADFDGNDALDIIALSNQGTVQIFTQNDSVYTREHTFNRKHATSVTMQDMNDDGLADIAITQNNQAATQLYISDEMNESNSSEESDVVEVDVSEESSVETEVNQNEDQNAQETQSTTVVVVKSSGSFGLLFLALSLLLVVARKTEKFN
ncbi:VCBS repeat-containing protein [Reinekea forsetii]|nr:VCBS repeat-containing protein [Reinekea forsetii]